jgi:transposase-like protein
MSSPNKSRKQYDLDYKRRIVQEYLRGEITTTALAEREGLERGQIYRWKVQLAEQARDARVETIADAEGVSLDQARKIRDLEEELEATQKKLAQLAVENELLGELVKKTNPSSPYARRSSSYADIKIALGRSKGRAR